MERKLVCGIGTNDANYVVQPSEGGKRTCCPFYLTWRSMLTRCYSKRYHRLRPTYRGCKVCKEWRTFSNFKIWMETQDWEEKQLDKDILGNGKWYSPETCCFIESWLNLLFVDHKSARGQYPIGVCWYKTRNKFRAHLRVHGKLTHIDYYDDAEEAYRAYCKAKLEYVQATIKDYPDQRIKQAVLKKAEALYTSSSNCKVNP